MDSSTHYQLQEKCGACRVAFRVGDRVAVLYLSESYTGEKIICNTLDASSLPLQWDRGHKVGSTYFCAEGQCGRCTSPDTAAVHSDCYNLYLQLAYGPERLAQLHRIATSRRPWRECNPQIDNDTPSDEEFLITKATEILPELELLPYELKAEVCSYLGNLSNDPLSRFSAVRTLANGLSQEQGGDWLQSVPLTHVQYWHRGTSPVLSRTPATTRRRLVIDSQGIRIIESSEAPASKSRPGVEVFVPAAPPEARCDFRYGTCRLSVATLEWWNNRGEMPVIWNIPSPPDLRDCTSLSETVTRPRDLTAVDLSNCFGITFFTCEFGVLRMHAHTKSQPTAEETFKRLTQHRQPKAMWIYVPLPSEDKLLGFGPRFRDGPRMKFDLGHCFRTSLRGDFTVGLWSGPDGVPYEISRRSLLIHDLDEHQDGFSNPVGMHYIHPRSDECDDFSPTKPRSDTYSPGPHECFSSAPLESVRKVWIYRTTRENFHNGVFCQGLIIDYMNGAQRALGSCPVGVIPAECCTDLRHIRFSCTSESEGSTVVIEVDPPVSDDKNHDEGWTRFQEGATLEVCFTRRTMHMSLVLDSEEQQSV